MVSAEPSFYFLLCFGSVMTAVTQLEEGDMCFTETMEESTCMKLIECPAAIGLFSQGKNAREVSGQFRRCGFANRSEIVCCPKPDETATKSNNGGTANLLLPERTGGERKSEKACNEYINAINDDSWSVTLHIFNGEEAKEGEYPHMAAVGLGTAFDCGGIVISKRYVLTAAHCVRTLRNIPPNNTRIGVTQLSKGNPAEHDYEIENITVHPDYDRARKYHDIALLRLSKDLEFNEFVQPACLYGDVDDPSEAAAEISVSGWGITEGDSPSDKLLKARMKLASNSECHERYTQPIQSRRLPEGITAAQMCARGSANNSDACQGDSGGPLQLYDAEKRIYRLLGVTSFGRACGSSTPGVYTRVSSYLTWIESHVWP